MARLPTVISFYCGDRYYYDCADRLRSDCDRLGLEHDIEELVLPEGTDWSQVTRAKVSFYRRKLAELGRGVLWVDVDCGVLRVPELLDGCRLDLVGFAQRFRYIRDYDPYDSSRFWVPGLLFLGHTPATLAFVELMHEIEQGTAERVTDDYCLHEAWLRHERELSVGFFPPSTVARSRAEITGATMFLYGQSGNVGAFKDTVVQHGSRDLLSNPAVADRVGVLHDTPQARGRALVGAAQELLADGERPAATAMLRTATRLLPDDGPAVRAYAEQLRAAGERDGAYGVLGEYLARHPQDGETRRMLSRFLQLYEHFDRAAEQIDLLDSHAEPHWRNYARSAAADLARERRAAGMDWSDRTPLWWMKTPYPGNFGDALSPYVVERVSGRPPRFVARDRSVLAIGSIVKFAGAASTVWGSGTARLSDALASDAEYRAVRGPLTRDMVLRSGGACPPVYGDPALLLPQFYTPVPLAQRYEIGLVRHVAHGDEPAQLDGVRDIPIARVGDDELEAFVDELASCDAILSTSLHGVIVAHAYGIPARWCTFGVRGAAIPGDGTKFLDYFRSVKLPEQTPLDLSTYARLDPSLARETDPRTDLQFDATTLMAAFPA